jgi:hypothetical protein
MKSTRSPVKTNPHPLLPPQAISSTSRNNTNCAITSKLSGHKI